MATLMVNGRVTNDIELKETKNKTKYVRFSVAETERKKVDGEYKNVSIFYSVIAFGNIAENLVKAKVKKGASISVVGRPEAQCYEDGNGENKASISVIIFDWNYLSLYTSKSKDENCDDSQDSKDVTPEVDDDLPF